MAAKHQMWKTNREDGYVAWSTWKNIRGRRNFTHSTHPNVQEGVGGRKRRADGEEEMPRKRMRSSYFTNPTGPREGPVKNRNLQRGERKACFDAGPSETTRCRISNASADPRVVDNHLVGPRKRKATDDGDTPERKRRCSTKSNLQVNVASHDDGGDVRQRSSWASLEEERIYRMSSLQYMRKGGFKEKYLELNRIGAGGYGSVYAGIRRSDRVPVAIKHIKTEAVTCDRVTCNGKNYVIVPEVAFMLKAAGLPQSVGQSAAVSILDCFIERDELLLVMERPAQSMDLNRYLQIRGGSLDEREAKMIMKQLVDAAIDLHSKGVFHRDIKAQNVLIQLDSDEPRVRIIDFGCSTFATNVTYSHFCGTRALFPPEYFDKTSYWAHATTVWQLGALFYRLLTGKFFSINGFLNNSLKINAEWSTDVHTLLNMCLTREPFFRATLEDLQDQLTVRQPNH